jgi:hypothetical protein
MMHARSKLLAVLTVVAAVGGCTEEPSKPQPTATTDTGIAPDVTPPGPAGKGRRSLQKAMPKPSQGPSMKSDESAP